MVTNDLFNITYSTQSVIFCFQMLCDCYIFLFEFFIWSPLIHNNYAISDFHPIFLIRDTNKALTEKM